MVVSRLAWEKTSRVEAAIQAVANLQGGTPHPSSHCWQCSGTQAFGGCSAQLANACVDRDVIKVVGQKLNP